MINSILDFIGHLHPILVHLPIGILLLACFFQWLTVKDRFASLQPAIPVVLFWGMISAILSCISGYFLSRSDDYDLQLVSSHQWLGISVAVVSVVLYLLNRKAVRQALLRWVSLGLIVLIMITGHLGGTLTHGAGYLTSAWNNDTKKGVAIPPVPAIQEAVVYTDLIQPLFQNRCYNCHGSGKQKGKLRLDSPDFILKGGESGNTIIKGEPGESELIERLLLPTDDEDHMPPKEKPQLTQNEIALLHWWISTGNDFTKKVKDLPQTDKIKPVLLALQAGSFSEENKITDVPEAPVKKADDKIVARLHNAGVIVLPVAKSSNYLSVNFVTAVSTADSIMELLGSLKEQLVWLKLSNPSIGDTAISHIASCKAITRLDLSNSRITDKGLSHLHSLQQLQYLNLVGTRVTASGIMQLKELKNLKNIFLYKTGVGATDWSALQKAFPGTQLDSGKYVVPTFVTDTARLDESGLIK